MFKNFIQRYKNANILIEQLQNDEWKFIYSDWCGMYLTAVRYDETLWFGSKGGRFLQIKNQAVNPLGIWNRYVWWKAVRPKLKELGNFDGEVVRELK